MDLVDLVLHGEHLVRAHDEPASLQSSARAFLQCVSGWENFTVEATSPAAERVLGAAMILNPGIRGGRSSRTVLLDVNIASGTLVANAARRVRETLETEWLIAVVVNALTDTDMQWNIEGVDSLFVCHDSSSRKCSQSSHNSVSVTAL